MFILLISILLLENFDCARTHGTFILISLLPASCSPSPNNKCRCRFAVMIFMNQQWFLFGSFILNTRLCVFGCFVCVFGSFVQIELMLKMRVKAEIQCLYTISHNFLTNVYLPNKLQYGGWI